MPAAEPQDGRVFHSLVPEFEIRKTMFKYEDPAKENASPNSNKQPATGMVGADVVPENELPPMSWDHPYVPRLPMVDETDRKHISINTVSASTVHDLLVGMEECLVIDCRFPYEYEGGHVQGAINVNTPDQLYQMFFRDPVKTRKIVRSRIPIIFYCEFSTHRGPQMYRLMR